ncbi:MAG: ABC transporter substrate-binding protein [Atopobiaceae bacterium]|jgi:putative spermidine/putrescine transport system substrate-binding protein
MKHNIRTMNMTRRAFAVSVACGIGSSVLLSACGQQGADASSDSTDQARDFDYTDWESVLAAARGQEVFWYGYGGNDDRNAWLADTLVPALKEKYDITLNVVGMNIDDILTQLSGEMQAGKQDGSIDFIWINGENFATAKENGYLWNEPYALSLPNEQAYVDTTSKDIAFDFGSETAGLEAPYGKAQMTFWVDSAKIADMPKNPQEFMEFCKAHPGQVTYPEPGDFTGTAFISCLIAGVIGKDQFETLATMDTADKEQVRSIVAEGMDYLRELKPYLWREGTTFPADATTVAQMYADGELVFNMGYGDPQDLVNDGRLPETTQSFLFDTGTVGNTNFMAIAANASHKAAALVAINEVLSPQMQLDQYKWLGNITVLDMDKLTGDDRAQFEAVELGSAQVPLEEKLKVRVSEASGKVIPVLEEIWHEDVLNG